MKRIKLTIRLLLSLGMIFFGLQSCQSRTPQSIQVKKKAGGEEEKEAENPAPYRVPAVEGNQSVAPTTPTPITPTTPTPVTPTTPGGGTGSNGGTGGGGTGGGGTGGGGTGGGGTGGGGTGGGNTVTPPATTKETNINIKVKLGDLPTAAALNWTQLTDSDLTGRWEMSEKPIK